MERHRQPANYDSDIEMRHHFSSQNSPCLNRISTTNHSRMSINLAQIKTATVVLQWLFMNICVDYNWSYIGESTLRLTPKYW
jgi:hypothetical protein